MYESVLSEGINKLNESDVIKQKLHDILIEHKAQKSMRIVRSK